MDSSEHRPIRIGLIGAGQRGQQHLENYQQVANAEIVAIADIDEALAQRVAAKFKIPDVYTDYHDLLGRDDLEAVDICLHNNLHRPVAVHHRRGADPSVPPDLVIAPVSVDQSQ